MSKKIKITCISDTHSQHKVLGGGFLPGGDILIHAGDFMSSGYSEREALTFFDWFNQIDNYDTKILIAGNHDRIMENEPTHMQGLLTGYKTIDYLQDDTLELWDEEDQQLTIYGTPWQPEFYNWAFNLPRGGAIREKWGMIPFGTDILVTHGPPFGKLDVVNRSNENVGCIDLMDRIKEIKPKICVFGHIHESAGYVFDGQTHYINASILDDTYLFRNKPINFDWDSITNEIEFV